MIRRTAWWVVRWLAGFAAGLTLAAAFLVWRLSVAPISLDYLIPSVARALAETESGLVVDIDHTLLSLGPGATIDIVARGVHLGRRDGEARLTLPELDIGFSLTRGAARHHRADADRAARAGAAPGAHRRRHHPSRPRRRRAGQRATGASSCCATSPPRPTDRARSAI